MFAFPKPNNVVCVYTDASKILWPSVITQTTEERLEKPVEDPQHDPLPFLGGTFSGAQKICSAFEKEANAVVQIFKGMDYPLW